MSDDAENRLVSVTQQAASIVSPRNTTTPIARSASTATDAQPGAATSVITQTPSFAPSSTETATGTSIPFDTPDITPTPIPVDSMQPQSSLFLASHRLSAEGQKAFAAPGAFVPAKTWSFDTSLEGWTANASISPFAWQSGGYMDGTIISANPVVFSPTSLGIDITNNTIIKIRMKSTTASPDAYLYFATNDDPVFDANKIIAFQVPSGSTYNEYTLDMSEITGWTGILVRLRLDLNGAGDFSIDTIQVGAFTPTATPTLTFTKTKTPESRDTAEEWINFDDSQARCVPTGQRPNSPHMLQLLPPLVSVG